MLSARNAGIDGYPGVQRLGSVLTQSAELFYGTYQTRREKMENHKTHKTEQIRCCLVCQIIDIIPTLSDYDLDQIRLTTESESLLRGTLGVQRDS
jgi:hypothetical protein